MKTEISTQEACQALGLSPVKGRSGSPVSGQSPWKCCGELVLRIQDQEVKGWVSMPKVGHPLEVVPEVGRVTWSLVTVFS